MADENKNQNAKELTSASKPIKVNVWYRLIEFCIAALSVITGLVFVVGITAWAFISSSSALGSFISSMVSFFVFIFTAIFAIEILYPFVVLTVAGFLMGLTYLFIILSYLLFLIPYVLAFYLLITNKK